MADVPEYQFPDDWEEQLNAHIAELEAMPDYEKVGWALVNEYGEPDFRWYIGYMQYGPCWADSTKHNNKDKFIGAFSEGGKNLRRLNDLGLHEEVVARRFEIRESTLLTGQRLVALKYYKTGGI